MLKEEKEIINLHIGPKPFSIMANNLQKEIYQYEQILKINNDEKTENYPEQFHHLLHFCNISQRALIYQQLQSCYNYVN